MTALLLDLGSAFRALHRAPSFTFVAAATLALGIASNAVVFSAVNSVLLRPLPYPDADRIVIVHGQERQRKWVGDLGASAFSYVRDHATSIQNVAAIYPSQTGVNLAGAGTVSYVKALRVSRSFFRTLGTEPVVGRIFDETEDKPNGRHVAILSYHLWSRGLTHLRIGDDNLLRINGDEYTAIGVMPQGFHSYPEADIWLPLQLNSATANPGADYRVIARLGPGESIKSAEQELKRLSDNYPLTQIPADERVSLILKPLQDFQTRDARKPLQFLSAAVFLLLLVACTNIAMLQLMRTSARTHEIAIRCALGSPRTRLIRLFLFEGTILAMLGGLLGIILANELLPLVLSLSPEGFAQAAEIRIDGSVLAFTFGVSAVIASFFGIAPTVKLSRGQLQGMLGETTLRTTTGSRHRRTGRLLLVIQTALTLMLVSSATLLLHRLLTIEEVDPGFDVRRGFVAQVSLSAQAFTTNRPTVRVLDDIILRLKSLPSVEGVASTNGLPLESGLNMPAHPSDAPKSTEGVEYRAISEDYFDVLHIPLVWGRVFAVTDAPAAQPVAIINETLARRWWPGTRAGGRSVTVGEEIGPEFTDTPRLVVGIVADVHQSSLEYPARPTIFIPIRQTPDRITAYANKYVLTSIIVKNSGLRDISDQVR